jgi:hypothetical protein
MGDTSDAAFLRAKARHMRQLAMMTDDQNLRNTLDQMAWELDERAQILETAKSGIDVLRDTEE